jgi:hypothetical protein
MDPSDLRAGVAESLLKSEPLDAVTFNAACFMLSRALDEIQFSVPEAAPLARRLLRIVGRVVIDTGTENAAPDVWPNTREMVVEWIGEAMRDLGYEIPHTPPAS